MRHVPGRWESGDAVLLATAPEDGLEAEAALIRFLWKAAPLLSLCHDVGTGGLERALAEAAEWSGRRADVTLPDEPTRRGGPARDVPATGSRDWARRGYVQIGQVR